MQLSLRSPAPTFVVVLSICSLLCSAFILGSVSVKSMTTMARAQPEYGVVKSGATLTPDFTTLTPTPTPTPTSTTNGATPTVTEAATSTETLTPIGTTTLTVTETPTAQPSPTLVCGMVGNLIPSPDPGEFQSLYGVAALSPSDVWAVGYARVPSEYHWPLTLHWNGTAWTRVPAPSVGELANTLTGVAAITSNDVWAAGYYYEDLTGPRSLIMHWDGVRWIHFPSPPVTGRTNELNAISAVSTNDVWAVGEYIYFGTWYTLIMHWDGVMWSVVPSPNMEEGSNYLLGVSALSSNDVWAVGWYYGTDRDKTLVMHWDGVAWEIVPSPNAPLNNSLVGVAAIAPNDVWAVGRYAGPSAPPQTLAMHWDGVQWSIKPSPNPSSVQTNLYGVSANTSNDVWAVGDYRVSGNDRTFVMHWDGKEWHTVPSPNHPRSDGLYDVTSLSPGDVWAVGSGNGSGSVYERTLTIRYTDPCYTCVIYFSDVRPRDYFYEAVRYLYCAGVISGYSDGTFRPFNPTTRSQLSKIVVLAEGWPLYTPPTPTFSDVPSSHPFFPYVETAFSRGIISGYSEGTFRPFNDVTRGQLSKIVVLAQGWPLYTPPNPTFTDVPATNPFYPYIETAYLHAIISGYSDRTFRPANNATRGQIAKIVYNALVKEEG